MITINKNSINKIALTLTEKSQLTGTTYNLFVFENAESGEKKIFTATDTSSYKQRYNEFQVIESATTENLLIGVVHITGNTSQLTYSIYESSNPFSSNTLSITATTATILETGRVLLNGIESDQTINSVYL
jgi:hypothetical protein